MVEIYEDVERLLNDDIYESIEKGITMIENIEIPRVRNFYLTSRKLVLFPNLLKRFLVHRQLALDDFEAMVARCIEYKVGETYVNGDRRSRSLEVLITYAQHHDVRGAILRLMVGKYIICDELYKKVNVLGIYDPWYDSNGNLPYTLPSHYELRKTGKYAGYRVAWHLLLYGKSRVLELIDWWNDNGLDCSFTAACDFFECTDFNTIQTYIIDIALKYK